MQPVREERSFTALVSDLTREVTDLLRNEVELAKVEIAGKVNQAENGLIAVAIGGAVLFAGLLVLLQAVIVGLQDLFNWTAPWLSPLIVGSIVAIVGVVMLQKGRKNLQAENLAPRRTADSLKRDKEFVKEKHDEITARQIRA